MKSPFVRILAVQSVATTLITICFLLIAETGTLSVFLAGISCILPTLFVTLMSLRPTPFGKSGLGHVLRGELGKLLLTAVLMTVIFTQYDSLKVVLFFCMFIFLQLCQILVPLIDAKRLIKR